MSIFEWAVIAFITASILFHVWRTGAANPESTGALGSKLNALSRDIGKLGGRVGQVETRMQDLEREAASTKDIARVEESIETVKAIIQGHRDLSAQTNRDVQRLYDVLVPRGLK